MAEESPGRERDTSRAQLIQEPRGRGVESCPQEKQRRGGRLSSLAPARLCPSALASSSTSCSSDVPAAGAGGRGMLATIKLDQTSPAQDPRRCFHFDVWTKTMAAHPRTSQPHLDEADQSPSLELLRLLNWDGHPLAAGQRHLGSTNPLVNEHSREAVLWHRATLLYLCGYRRHASSRCLQGCYWLG